MAIDNTVNHVAARQSALDSSVEREKEVHHTYRELFLSGGTRATADQLAHYGLKLDDESLRHIHNDVNKESLVAELVAEYDKGTLDKEWFIIVMVRLAMIFAKQLDAGVEENKWRLANKESKNWPTATTSKNTQ
jgi:hypothetical protein